MAILLPTGTVTFLFTDIEGSTRMAEENPDKWGSLHARHHEIMREAIDSCHGYTFQTVGDSFCASFDTAFDGLQAAIKAQTNLLHENWGSMPIKVRMGIHTGNAEILPIGDYSGYLTLSRVQRLMSAGHGGQILLSQSSQNLVREDLPEKVFLRDLGEQRLKDLTHPEHIYQVIAPGLPVDFPALKTLTTQLNNLPNQPTPFVGREREISSVMGLLRNSQVRLVTLSGAGGTGKTRLSLQAGAELVDEFEHGVWFVELATLKDPKLLLPAIAATLKVNESSGTSVVQALNEFLLERHLLLILDNFEQIIASAPLLGSLLSSAPKIKILVSSREVLRLRGEHDFPVPPMSLPELRRKQTAAVLAQYEAVALFAQNAQAANPTFALTEDNAEIIAQICSKLDGLPLAIELAAARSRLLKPAVMLEKLRNRLDTLTGGARDLPGRQQTIRGTIDWSYELLDNTEKVFFSRLGVFVGGWTLESAEAVCGKGLHGDVLSLLESLLNKSLIRQVNGKSGEDRFTMLETIHDYAFEKLTQSGELQTSQHELATMIGTVLDNTLHAQGGTNEVSYFAKLDDELDNLRTTMEWSLARNQPELAFKVSRLWEYWVQRVNKLEPLHWVERALKMETDAPDLERAYAFNGAGNLEIGIAEWHRAEKYYQTALDLFKKLNHRDGISRCLNNLGNIAKSDKEFEKARQLYEESMDYHDPDSFTISLTLDNLGNIARIREDWEVARGYFLRSREICERLGAAAGVSYADWFLGIVALAQMDLEEARQRFTSAAKANYIDTNPMMRDNYTGLIGYVHLLEGDLAKARPMLSTGLAALPEFLRAGSDITDAWFMIDGQARLDLLDGNPGRAAQLFGISSAWRKKDDYPISDAERPGYEDCLSSARAALGENAFEETFHKGFSMSIKEAVAFANKE